MKETYKGNVDVSIVNGEITFSSTDKSNLADMLNILWNKQKRDRERIGFERGKEHVYRDIGEAIFKDICY